MTDNINTLTAEIEYKIRKIVQENRLLIDENVQKTNKIIELKTELDQHKNRISEFEQKIKTIKLAKSIENKRELTETKLQINEIVRELDTCISLLNK